MKEIEETEKKKRLRFQKNEFLLLFVCGIRQLFPLIYQLNMSSMLINQLTTN
jgi:hypothetical protein